MSALRRLKNAGASDMKLAPTCHVLIKEMQACNCGAAMAPKISQRTEMTKALGTVQKKCPKYLH